MSAVSYPIRSLRVPGQIMALLLALRLHEADVSLLEALTNEEWESLLSFCDLSQLTLVLARFREIDIPSWVKKRLETNVRDNSLRFDRAKKTYEEVKVAFAEARIDHVVIKGFTHIPDYVPDPAYRMQSDIDVYCLPEAVGAARIALEAIGYRPSVGIDYSQADHIPTMVRPGDWKWRENMFDPEMPLSVELHVTLWNEGVLLFPVQGVHEFWKRRVMRSIEDMSFQCFSRVDHMGYLALHILRNLLPGNWTLHHVRELAVFLDAHATDDAFWVEWIETHDSSLRAHEAIAFYYARAWFSCNLHDSAEQEVNNLPLAQRKWLDQCIWSSLESIFEPNKNQAWLHWSLIHNPSDRLTLLRRYFLPNHLPLPNSPSMRFVDRQPRVKSDTHPYFQYCSALISRCKAFSYASLKALLVGVRWRISCIQSTAKPIG